MAQPSRVIIMAAGAFKRFDLKDADGKPVPKPFYQLEEDPNIIRTIKLCQKLVPNVDLWISMFHDLAEDYKKRLDKCGVTGYNVVLGQRQEEGYKFVNIKDAIVDNTVVLYADCRYDEEDLKTLLYSDPPVGGGWFLRREKTARSIIGKAYPEAYGVKFEKASDFTDRIDAAFKQHGEKATSHHLFKMTKPAHLHMACPWTDDVDYAREYEKFKKALATGKEVSR